MRKVLTYWNRKNLLFQLRKLRKRRKPNMSWIKVFNKELNGFRSLMAHSTGNEINPYHSYTFPREILSHIARKNSIWDKDVDEKIYKLKKKGKTFQEIGKIVGITRQRSHQRYNRYISIPLYIRKSKDLNEFEI